MSNYTFEIKFTAWTDSPVPALDKRVVHVVAAHELQALDLAWRRAGEDGPAYPKWTRFQVRQDIDDPVKFNEHGLRISADVFQLQSENVQSENDWENDWIGQW